MNELTVENGRIFLDDKEIECVTAFELKSSTDGTVELSLKLIVDLISMAINQHSGDDLSKYESAFLKALQQTKVKY